MKPDSPGPCSPAMDVISPTGPGSAYNSGNIFLSSFPYDDTCDLSSDLTLMPQFFTAESPASSLSTPTTQTSFEDFHSSASSSHSYTPTTLLADSDEAGDSAVKN